MAVPNDLRQMNRRQAVLALLRAGVSTRPELSRLTGLSLPTTGKIVDQLTDEGIIRAFDPPDSGGRARPGRPDRLLKLDDLKPRFLAIQLGPIRTRLQSLAIAPPVQSVPGDAWARVIPTATSLKRWAAKTVEAGRAAFDFKPAAVLLSLPGVLDESTGRTLLSPNARWMERAAVAAELQSAMDIPVHAVQEIRCLALGHRLTDPSADNFLLVDFGIGIGSAAMIDGQLLGGRLPFTGELGHTPVPGNSIRCGCGGIGCLETLVGRGQLLGDRSDDADQLSGPEQAVFTAGFNSGRLRGAIEAAGVVIAGAMNVLGLNHAVITGFVADLPPEVFLILQTAIAGASVTARFGPVRTEAARRHRLAGLASVAIDRIVAPSR